MTVANGSCGTQEHDAATIAQIRREEARAAAATMGAVFHESLVNDLEIFYERPLLAKLGAIVRQVAPEILLIPSPEDYMEDHIITGRLAVTAAFCRGLRNFPVDPPTPPVTGDVTVYHAQPHGNRDGLGTMVHPTLFINVTSVIEQKAALLEKHRSQKDWLNRSQGMDSYIATMRGFSQEVGQMSGRYPFAEGWRQHLHLGLCKDGSDPLADTLRDYAFNSVPSDFRAWR